MCIYILRQYFSVINASKCFPFSDSFKHVRIDHSLGLTRTLAVLLRISLASLSCSSYWMSAIHKSFPLVYRSPMLSLPLSFSLSLSSPLTLALGVMAFHITSRSFVALPLNAGFILDVGSAWPEQWPKWFIFIYSWLAVYRNMYSQFFWDPALMFGRFRY